MNRKQVESIRERFSWYETDDLLKIWQAHNTKEWTEEAFEALRQILITRMETLPSYEDTGTAEYLLESARRNYDGNDFENALTICDEAILVAPHLSEAHLLKGMTLDELNRMEEAVESLETAVHLDPNSTSARDYLRMVRDDIIRKTTRSEERILAALSHGSSIVLPYGILISAIIWILERKKSKFVAFQCLQALVFQAANFLFLVGGIIFISILAMIASALANNQLFNLKSSEGFFIGALLVYLCLLLIFLLYGIIGAVHSLLGKNFRYLVIGNLIDRFYLNAHYKQEDLDSV